MSNTGSRLSGQPALRIYSIFLRRAPDGRVARYLALGTISGDWGGGYGLGLEVLWHAVRAEDGRSRDTILTSYLTSHFGVERVEEVTIGV